MTIGVLGGLGPAASCCFYDMLNRLGGAVCDQQHPDILLYSKASVPDRTAYLMGRSALSPLPALREGVQTLARAGAGVIAVPCVTAHHFHLDMQAAVPVPVLSMLEITARALAREGVTRAGLLATEGAYRSGAFCACLAAAGVTPVLPTSAQARVLMDMIYGIKSGRMPEPQLLESLSAGLVRQGAQRVILGCTELSLLGCEGPQERYIDPLRLLARETLDYHNRNLESYANHECIGISG